MEEWERVREGGSEGVREGGRRDMYMYMYVHLSVLER